MTAAPSLEPTRDQVSFFRQLYSGMTKPRIELSTIDGDPKDRAHSVFSQGWETYTRASDIARKVNEYAAAGLNVYCSVSGYQRSARNAEILPGMAIFADDVPEHGPLAWSLYVKTSPDSGQGILLLTEAVSAEERVRLARRLAVTCGADPSGVDAQQLVRPPGSINGKAKCKGYRSWLKIDTGRRYTVAEVEAATKDVASRPRVVGSNGQREPLKPETLDAAQRLLSAPDLLFNPDGLPWRVAARTCSQTYKVLTGETRFAKKDKPTVQDASMLRYVAMKGCAFFGYDDAAIVAIQLRYWNYEHLEAESDKGKDQVLADIGHILAQLRADPELAHVTPTPLVSAGSRRRATIPDTPRKSRARQDRPQRIDDDGYLDWWTAQADASGKVTVTRKQSAAALSISVPTVDRIERRLRERGLLFRHTSKDRRASWLIIPGAINIDAAPAETATATDVVTESVPVEVLSAAPRNMVRACADGKHTPPAALSAPPSEAGGDAVPVPRAPALVIREPLVAMPVSADDWAQSTIGPLPRRKRAADRPPAEQLRALEAQLGKVRKKKRKMKDLGADYMLAGLERAAVELQEKIARLAAELATPDNLSPPAEPIADGQLTIDTAIGAAEAPPRGVCSPSPAPGVPPADAGPPSPHVDPAVVAAGLVDRLRQRKAATL